MTECRAELITTGGTVTLDKVVGFTFEKERYTPYTLFTGTFIGECVPAEVTAVRFYCANKSMHYGTADSVECELSGEKKLVKIRSYSFSMLLGQNQSEPGIITSPNLKTLLTLNGNTYSLGYQSDTKTVNYVYIKDRTTIWEAVCIYTMKAYGSYPFIYNTNVVRCERDASKLFSYSNEKICSVKRGVKLTNLISHGYTTDVDGNWSVSAENEYAKARNITKKKYYTQDMEWAYNLSDELKYKLNYADRGREYVGFTYVGYKGEDLIDHAEIDAGGLTLSDMEIDSVKIVGTKKGVFTTIGIYKDSYCNT